MKMFSFFHNFLWILVRIWEILTSFIKPRINIGYKLPTTLNDLFKYIIHCSVSPFNVFSFFAVGLTSFIFYSVHTVRYILWILSKSNWFISISEQWISLSNLSFLSINETHPCLSGFWDLYCIMDLQSSHMRMNFFNFFSLIFQEFLKAHSALLHRGNLICYCNNERLWCMWYKL